MPELSIGIFLQQRDIRNTVLLLRQIFSMYPEIHTCVFYSGPKPLHFQELTDAIKLCGADSIIAEDSKTIGVAVNCLMYRLNSEWVYICDGDILFTEEFLKNLESCVPKQVSCAVIQGNALPQLGASVWARFDCLNDMIACLSDRTKPAAWFSQQDFTIPKEMNLTTLHGGVMLINKNVFMAVGGMEEDSLLVQRALAAKLRKQGYAIKFNKSIEFHHIYPNTLRGVLKRKIFHAWGSALNRVRHPEVYSDSFRIRLKMFVSAFRPPRPFWSFYGRTYFFLTMALFTTMLSYYLFRFRLRGIN